jgi:putative Holliday junction resolvase
VTRLLGIDLGEKRIGLAVADSHTGTVRPLSTVRRADVERDAATLRRVAAEQRVDELVVGLPLNMDGSEGTQAAITRGWATAIAEALQLPLAWRDERLTSEVAEYRVGAARRGRSGGPPSASSRNAQRARVDREAAAAIAQAELDARSAAAQSAERDR